jgi:hypothetical protein
LESSLLINFLPFSASKNWASKAEIVTSERNYELHLTGFCVGAIDTITQDATDNDGHIETVCSFEGRYPTTNLSRKEVYNRLTTAVDPDSTIEPPKRSPNCQGFWEYLGGGLHKVDLYFLHSEFFKHMTEFQIGNPLSGHQIALRSGREEPLLTGRAFFGSTHGFLGLAPKSAVVGDLIYILAGVRVPFILRKNKNGTFGVVGESYVYGIMHGETIHDLPQDKVEDIVLI